MKGGSTSPPGGGGALNGGTIPEIIWAANIGSEAILGATLGAPALANIRQPVPAASMGTGAGGGGLTGPNGSKDLGGTAGNAFGGGGGNAPGNVPGLGE